MCVRITIPELGVDEMVCNHREAHDLAVKIAKKVLGLRARKKANTPVEASILNAEYQAALHLLLRKAALSAGVYVSPWR